MANSRSIAGALVAVAVLVTGVATVASAMQAGGRGGGAPAGDPTKVTVIKRPYDRAPLIKPSTLTDAEYQGRTIWLQRCAYCHDGVGNISYNTMGPWLGAETVQTLTEVAFRAIVAAGTERMPGFSYTLKPKQVDDLMAFIKTIPASTKPTADQLNGRLPGGAAGTPSRGPPFTVPGAPAGGNTP